MITQQELKEYVTYNKVTGEFLNKKTGRVATTREKTKSGVRLRIYIKGVSYYASRMAVLYVTGKYPDAFVKCVNIAGGNVSAGQLNAQAPNQPAPRLMDDSGNFLSLNNADSLIVDLGTATAASINDLRTAFKVQEWLELNARAGTRYSEQLRAHFGVISDDARLQRPEYIGGSSSPVVIGEVLQTSQTDTTPLGEMGGRAISSGMGMTDAYYAKEHGWIIGVVSIMPEALYMQGLPRKLSRLDKFDYYFPMFAHLGEQAVKNKEIFYSGNVVTNDETFGYQSRYAELS